LSKEMLINMAQEEECRIAVVENQRLEELYVERSNTIRYVGNIYKGKVCNVEPSIQACFVDFGIGKNGFLHISDLHTSYFPSKVRTVERVGQKHPRRDRPPIQDCLKRGQEIIVQVIKEGIGTKGPTLTTYLSIPGRFLVLMPGMNRMGVSRKIEDEDARSKMRDVLSQLRPPQDMGFILRTASEDRNKRELQQDMNYLVRLWKGVQDKMKSEPGPCELYQESSLVIRTLRDIYSSNIQRIICDSEKTLKQIRDFLRIAMPRTKTRIVLHEGPVPLFTKYKIEEEIQKIQTRHVPLASGGSLVIDPTEAIVAIDVNSGKYRVHEDAETTAYKINMEAAPEIARQLRLRDLGGVIIIDFIDMLNAKHRQAVEKALRDAVAGDRARNRILRMSRFGIVEMTRQRIRPSLKSGSYVECPHCRGSGVVKTPESVSIEIVRYIQSAVQRSNLVTLDVEVSPAVAGYLLNQKRAILCDLEKQFAKTIGIRPNYDLSNEQTQYFARDNHGNPIALE